jgi:hypothetical protein
MSKQQQEEFTRTCFSDLASYKRRVSARTANSRDAFKDITRGMKESAMRELRYLSLTGIRPLVGRPDKDPLYLRFRDDLDDRVASIKRDCPSQPGSSRGDQWIVDRLRQTFGDFEEDRGDSEVRPGSDIGRNDEEFDQWEYTGRVPI